MVNTQNDKLEAKLFDSDIIDFGQYLQTIKRYFWRIAGLAIFLTLLVSLIVLSLTPIYSAKVTLLIESEQANVLSIEEVYGIDSSRKEYFETQYEILRSRQIAQRVVERMQLHEHPMFNRDVFEANKGAFDSFMDELKLTLKSALPFLPQTPTISPSEDDILLANKAFATTLLLQNTRVVPVKNTQVVEVFIETPDAKLSADIANTVADIYIESYLEAKLEMTEKATAWLNNSLQGLRTKLSEAEGKLADFYEQEQLVDIDGVVGLASEELQQLSDQLLDAEVALQRSQSIYDQVNRQGASINELSSVPEVLNHPSIQSVKREEVIAQSKVSELREVYGPKHPVMIAANAELSSIQGSLSQQIANLVSGITNEYRTTQTKVRALRREVEEAKAEFRKLSSLESTRRTLQRDVDINQQLYDSFFTRLKETDQLGGFESANARVLDSAVPPIAPAKPNKLLIIAAAMFLSTGLGVFLALSLEALSRGIRSTDDVERKLSQRMLGLIPWQAHKKHENLSLRHFFDPNHHIFSESVRTLRTSLQLLNIDKPSQTILVTSSVPKEGKSTVSVNLAFALGQLSKVLLLDTDLRKPSLGRLFELPGFQPGLANVISGSHSLEECIVCDQQSKVDILSAGTLPPNPQELLASQKFAELMQTLRDKYDYIVVDSAPTQAVSDAIVVSKQCDSLIYVVKADSTSDKIINNGLSRFVEIGHRIDGVVLNQVDLKKAQRTGEYSGYYDQYGYNSYQADDKTS
ncbi:polysaccharide biosynthesis tyrosine autokinase [Glaciecola sp. XM2]|jgi:capsular exopolysaccharide synthesis family protein|uniref:GumC family protein n=1 Tax=Glaciecola sp. XM2 TaxID=1914931 RepID=UPI001BDF5D02|nr:polysaccharide biosynthesis tyrosine autokinase [Glaciecola sp. XM2]MBT1452456.1 polysaccharide biosynthesis tyrosine autokinase [Glaciecola sp. XM2]